MFLWLKHVIVLSKLEALYLLEIPGNRSIHKFVTNLHCIQLFNHSVPKGKHFKSSTTANNFNRLKYCGKTGQKRIRLSGNIVMSKHFVGTRKLSQGTIGRGLNIFHILC